MHEIKALGPLLGRCGHLSRERMDVRLTQYDATPAQTHVLLYLYHHGGQATQGQVTEHLKVKPSTANGILCRMEEKGLVTRAVSGTDARQRLVFLTKKGEAKQEAFKQVFLETEALMTKNLSAEEKELLFALLQRVAHNLEEDRSV